MVEVLVVEDSKADELATSLLVELTLIEFQVLVNATFLQLTVHVGHVVLEVLGLTRLPKKVVEWRKCRR